MLPLRGIMYNIVHHVIIRLYNIYANNQVYIVIANKMNEFKFEWPFGQKKLDPYLFVLDNEYNLRLARRANFSTHNCRQFQIFWIVIFPPHASHLKMQQVLFETHQKIKTVILAPLILQRQKKHAKSLLMI